MDRRLFLKQAAVAGAGLSASCSTAQPVAPSGAKKPNVLMITAHDLGRHLGCYGVGTVQSPHIDALAARGIRFSNYFAADCVCSPSRGAMLTGRYPQSNGLMGLTHKPWSWRLNDGERHIASILKDAGYETILVGLQHVTQGDPKSLGYDKVLAKERIAKKTVVAAVKELQSKKSADRPFFMKIGFFEVHRPFTNGIDDSKGVFIPPYLKDTPEIRKDLAQYQAAIRFFDECVGGILDGLAKSDCANDTIVVFTDDHGIPYPGAKWCLRDAGMEIALIMHQPGTKLAGGKVCDRLLSNVDLLPTLLDLCGAKIPGNVQGISFAPILNGTKQKTRSEIYAQRTSHALRDNTSRAIRTEQYKLVRNFEPGRTVIYPTDAVPQRVASHVERPKRQGGQQPVVQLYDIRKDPHEFENLSLKPEYAAVVRELSDKLWAWMEEVEDPILKGPLVKPYYEEAIQDYQLYKKNR